MLGVLKRVLPEMPRADQIGIDLRVVASPPACPLLTALVFAAAPLVHQLRADANEALAQGGRRTVAGSSRLRQFLTVAEIALAFVLVVGAGLIVQSLWRLMQVEPGFSANGCLTAECRCPRPATGPLRPLPIFIAVCSSASADLPGVHFAGATAFLPLGGTTNTWGFQIEIQPSPRSRRLPAGYAGFHRVDGHPCHAGRRSPTATRRRRRVSS